MFCETALSLLSEALMNVGHAREGVEDSRDGASDAALFALVDVTRRRLAALERQNPPSPVDRFGHYLIEGVYALILVVTMGAWAVLGFVVWVPLLVRATILLAGTVFYVSLFRDPEKLAHAQRSVHFAVRLYARGFEHFLTFYRKRGEPVTPVGLFEPLTAMTRDDFLIDGVWVATVWLAAVFAVNAAAAALFG
jgi:hypothetical protein